MDENQGLDLSEKSYGVAVSLCMVFGIIGIHHFYLGNKVHGILDLSLFVVGMTLFMTSLDQTMVIIGALLLFVDLAHTFVVTILLLIGKARDGQGKLVSYPGQF